MMRRLLLCMAGQNVCLALHTYTNTYIYRPHFSFCDRFHACFSQRNESIWVNGGVAPFILRLGTSWRPMVSFTPWQLYPKGKSTLPTPSPSILWTWGLSENFGGNVNMLPLQRMDPPRFLGSPARHRQRSPTVLRFLN